MKWFRDTWSHECRGGRSLSVLDVGSADVNGSYRELFTTESFKYVGLDLADGPNVHICPENAYKWKEIEDNVFDIVISGQSFEHIEFFWLTMAEIARVLKPGGLVCIIVPRYAHRHRYPLDCYRFDVDGMVALDKWTSLEVLHASSNLAPPNAPFEWYGKVDTDSMLVARKGMEWRGLLNIEDYTFSVPDIEDLAGGMLELKEQAWEYRIKYKLAQTKYRLLKFLLGRRFTNRNSHS